MSLFESYLFDNDTPNLAQVINTANAGVWELDDLTKKVRWSIGFYRILGYEPGEIECSYSNFTDNLIYYEDKSIFLKSVNDTQHNQLDVVYIRLLTKSGYEWFQSNTQKHSDKLTGTIINIHQFKVSQFKLTTDNRLVTETNQLVNLGRWEIDVAANKLYLSNEALDIFELKQHITEIEQLVSFFEPHNQSQINSAIQTCITNCRPFDFDLKMITARNNAIWVKLKAVANIDHYGKCFVIKGIIQNIDHSKQNENKLKSSLNIVNQKNKRLENFAYIVSHNLRSYIGNLQIMVNLHEETDEDRPEVFGHIKTISSTLNTMIEHLNEIIKIDSEKDNAKTLIEFDLLFKNIVGALQTNIEAAHATVSYDFSKCRSVEYLPAYLESIFHNLLTNALKYRHPERDAIIRCESKFENGHCYLIFEDNGLGIDMERYGSKIFGLYQTFHRNSDAQGIGLYITRNQIEALGGEINVESTLNVGTRFIIKLV
ncbi:PAS domain-containing sensor histidine kinase [Mucilaginibacter aquariorum]|uniref:histidine kinase n=1 Tax=Mucilaginibacter aquariorum TaxID=2967225 RepID=A0ABT1SX61_9SPHI|nr:PAS domain-containing sensor histidine kinase [Mucilaginibacter aquariorum]MCQ6956318.1 PAS domain-containing sensor histidine kinase [Mucilaginibacter aquariorum]